MYCERSIKIFVGSAEEVERQVNEFFRENAETPVDRVFIRHWGAEPVSLVVYMEYCETEPKPRREPFRKPLVSAKAREELDPLSCLFD